MCRLIFIMVMASLLAACSGNPRNGGQASRDNVAPEGCLTRGIGEWEATWIRDVDTRQSPEIFADAPEGLIDSLGLSEGVPSSISVFLLRKGDTSMLFDAGLGGKESRMLPLLDSLGVRANDIKYLFLTHLHNDHIGGMLSGDTVVFPNAEVFVAKKEYDGWMNMPNDKKAKAETTLEAYADRLRLFEFGDTLPEGVVAIDASGHTPGHTVYKAGNLLVVGDLMHGVALQLGHPDICAAYDMDKPAAVESRVRILKLAGQEGLVMAGMHFPEPGFLSADGQ